MRCGRSGGEEGWAGAGRPYPAAQAMPWNGSVCLHGAVTVACTWRPPQQPPAAARFAARTRCFWWVQASAAAAAQPAMLGVFFAPAVAFRPQDEEARLWIFEDVGAGELRVCVSACA